MQYNELNDYELISYINERNEEASDLLYKKYQPLIVSIAKKFYNMCQNKGIDLNDFIQEGMIGFSYAINSYSDSKDAIFYTYAKKCVERKIISMMIKSNRLKNKFLNESLSYDNVDDFHNFESVLGDSSINPEVLVLSSEAEAELKAKACTILTDYEMQVFELKAAGFNYKEIADMLTKEPKNIDNALQRIRNKLKSVIDNTND